MNVLGTVYLNSSVLAGVPPGQQPKKRKVPPQLLRKIAAGMLPLYARIARSSRYADRWSKAVVKADLDEMQKLLRVVSPRLGKTGLGSNGIGYFISFTMPGYEEPYANGTTIPPGIVQFVFPPGAHRAVAAAVLPFYRKLANSRAYARKLSCALADTDPEKVARLIRPLIPTRSLRSLSLESDGFGLNFRFPQTRYPYRNLLFRDGVENG